MNLVWKLLRRHISAPQFAGFFFANLLGMLIVLVGVQFYCDVMPLFQADDLFMKDNYLVVSKRLGAAGTLSGEDGTFSETDIAELRRQPFCKGAAPFLSSSYKVTAAMGISGRAAFSTDLFFEAVPDEYVELEDGALWRYDPSSREIPIILPRSYLALYNFGFAQSRGLPKLSESLAGMIDMKIFITANGKRDVYKGRVVGFSSSLSTILVPLSFLEWSNEVYHYQNDAPQRLIMAAGNPTDERINTFMQSKGYDVEDDKLEAGKITFVLRNIIALVLLIGAVICLLSLYILMLSIYLLVQKNTEKLENLLLLGYTPGRVSRPYQLLTVGMNAIVLVSSLVLLLFLRKYYLSWLFLVFPNMQTGKMLPALLTGGGLFLIVGVCNCLLVRRKVLSVWKHKD